MIISVLKMWSSGVFNAVSCSININCDRLTGITPRSGFLVKSGGCCNDDLNQYDLTLQRPPADTFYLEGVYIEMDGLGILLDAVSVSDITDACNACCATDTTVVPGRYNGTYPSPVERQLATYTFTRVDTGGSLAFQKAALDYLGQYKVDTFKIAAAYNEGTSTSTYKLQAYSDPVYLTGDTQTSESSRIFDSNAPAALGVDEHYELSVYNNGILVAPVLSGASIAALVSAATGSSPHAALGTYSSSSGKVRLTSTTVYNATLTIAIVPD